MHLHVLASLITVAAGVTACGGGAAAPSVALSAPVVVPDLHEVYSLIASISPAQRAASIAAVGAKPVSQYYAELLAGASDQPAIVNGVKVSGILTALKAQTAGYAALDKSFPNMSALWKHAGIDTTKPVTEADFVSQVEAALGQTGSSKPALGLVGGFGQAICNHFIKAQPGAVKVPFPSMFSGVAPASKNYFKTMDTLLDKGSGNDGSSVAVYGADIPSVISRTKQDDGTSLYTIYNTQKTKTATQYPPRYVVASDAGDVISDNYAPQYTMSNNCEE